MSAPSTTARQTVQSIISDEFSAERISVRPGFLDTSLGQYGPCAGVVPVSEEPNPDDRLQLITTLQVELYAMWEADPDPERIVDPATIEDYAYRFRTALGDYQQTPTSSIWWFRLDELTYDADPTGNISRFVAVVSAYGQNPAA